MTHKQFLIDQSRGAIQATCAGEMAQVSFARFDGRQRETWRCAECGVQVLLTDTICMPAAVAGDDSTDDAGLAVRADVRGDCGNSGARLD